MSTASSFSNLAVLSAAQNAITAQSTMSSTWESHRYEAQDLSVRVSSIPIDGFHEHEPSKEVNSSGKYNILPINSAVSHWRQDSSSLFELGLAGNKGYGLFATKDIPKGTRVLAEQPCIRLRPDEPKIALCNQLEGLKNNPERHAQYTDLSSLDETVHPSLRQAIRIRFSTRYQYSGAALDAAVDDMVKCHAIFLTNAVVLGAEGCHGEGLFLQYSRINHSCLPNVQNSYDPKGFENVHAIRDVAAGEELLTSYTSNAQSRKHRRANLRGWGFECQCEACEGNSVVVHERRRQRLEEIVQGLTVYQKADQLMRAISPYPVPRNGREALAWAEEAVSLLKQEGLLGVDLSSAYRQCSELSIAEGQLEKAKAYAKKEMEIERICLGESTTDWLNTPEQPYASANAWIKHLENLSEQDEVKLRMNEKRHAKDQKKADRKAAKKAAKGAR